MPIYLPYQIKTTIEDSIFGRMKFPMWKFRKQYTFKSIKSKILTVNKGHKWICNCKKLHNPNVTICVSCKDRSNKKVYVSFSNVSYSDEFRR
jgi:hypothetical protein